MALDLSRVGVSRWGGRCGRQAEGAMQKSQRGKKWMRRGRYVEDEEMCGQFSFF
jgi:hypothetical protein